MAVGHRCGDLAAVLGIPVGPDQYARRDRRPHGRCDCALDFCRANPSRGMGQSPLLVRHLALGSNRHLVDDDRDGFKACDGLGRADRGRLTVSLADMKRISFGWGQRSASQWRTLIVLRLTAAGTVFRAKSQRRKNPPLVILRGDSPLHFQQ